MSSFGVGGNRWSMLKVSPSDMQLAQFVAYLFADGQATFRFGMADGPGVTPLEYYQHPNMHPFNAPVPPPCVAGNALSWVRIVEPDSFFGPQFGWLYGYCGMIDEWRRWAHNPGLFPGREYWMLDT